MSKYKTGDKVVLGILSIDGDGYYIVGSEHHSWWASPKNLDEVVEPLSTYTDQLNDKIKRQEEEIIRLLKENAELDAKYEELRKALNEFNKRIDDVCNTAKAAGQEEAWKLAQKIICSPGYSISELKEIFGSKSISWCISCNTYSEAAAKVAEWERAKEEIHVGDIVRIHEGNDNDLCIICSSSDGYYNAVDEYGAVYPTLYKKMISKTGRHIDVNAWMAQIGGER